MSAAILPCIAGEYTNSLAVATFHRHQHCQCATFQETGALFCIHFLVFYI